MAGGPLRSGWRGPLVLGGLCAVLAAVLAGELTATAPALPEALTAPGQGLPAAGAATTRGRPATAGTGDDAGEPFTIAPAHAFSDITDRPLFHSSRRPVVGAAPPAEAAARTDKPAVLLRGTIVVGNGQRLALLEVDGGQRVFRPGNEVKGWVITAVEPEQVVMEQGESRAVYSLTDTLRQGAAEARTQRSAKQQQVDRRQQQRSAAEQRARQRAEQREQRPLDEPVDDVAEERPFGED